MFFFSEVGKTIEFTVPYQKLQKHEEIHYDMYGRKVIL
jgi:hypothetical protein